MNSKASSLVGVDGKQVALTDVDVTALLHNLLAEVSITQSYINREKTNIEAVYTFPLPLNAVLLGMQVSIGDRVLKGVVIEKNEAQNSYENAVADGDAAVMLEKIESGLYTMNVGNLLPGEKASISLTYSILYRWSGDQLRFFLPTTIAPRYGESRHSPHQTPESSLTVENQFSLKVEIRGSLKMAQFVCPSHKVNLVNNEETTVITLNEAKVAMDRDFVLNIKAPTNQKSFVLSGADGGGVAAVASFQPFFPGLRQPKSLDLAIVVDCSGSMQGDSIQQAKQALHSIIEGLQSQDRISIVAFGNATKALSAGLLPCTAENIQKAKAFAGELDANMGGTDIDVALQDTYSVVAGRESADMLLITDGEVSNWAPVVSKAKSTGHRIFTVGVGSAVAEAFVRELASKTGGECELVAPCEGMAEKVVRHFERMRAPKAKRAAVHWPEGAKSITPEVIGSVFEGDTIITSAQFKSLKLPGVVVLEIETEAGEISRQELQLDLVEKSDESISSIARLAASFRLKDATKKRGLATALKYQLVSPWTNYLVIGERGDAEKAYDVPALRKVPQTLAAGWGGVGSASPRVMNSSVSFCAMPSFSMSFDSNQRPASIRIPDQLQKFVDLINDQPDRLRMDNMLDLLHESLLFTEFSEIFSFARNIGLDERFAAFILVVEILDKATPYFSDAAMLQSDQLVSERKTILIFMSKLMRRSDELTQCMESSVVRHVFEGDLIYRLLDGVNKLRSFDQFIVRVRKVISRLGL